MSIETSQGKVIGRTLGRLVMVFAFSVLSESSVAHDWYSGIRNAHTGVGCCGGRDCGPIDVARIVETTDQFIVDGIWRFNKSEAMPSRDGAYHACIWGGRPRCFFVPMNV
ncbi:MAG TPA: hypothetical protein VH933_07095 [Aestuariivirgaceae bacterium]|jgi:hypothetical protein